jgi:GNAT superfamily N-acetyltransferase
MRVDPAPESGILREHTAEVVRTSGLYNLIDYSNFAAEDADRVIAQQIAYFATRGDRLEWKVYAHDGLPGLGSRLAAQGFVPDQCETVMTCQLRQWGKPILLPPGIEIRKIDDSGLDDFVRTASSAYEKDCSWMRPKLEGRLAGDVLSCYVAYVAAEPIAVAQLKLPPGRSFGGAYTAGVVPQYRRRGIYRALVAIRALEARKRGYRYLFAEAFPTSRPILQAMGFAPLTTVQGWVLTFPVAAEPS